MPKSNFPEVLVSSLPVAPHRYLWNAPFDEASLDWKSKEIIDNAPYKAGEVVYTIYGDTCAKALIERVWCARNSMGYLHETYWVRRETTRGVFSKRAYTIYPGYIQRGYYRAGLAPDIPKGAI